jgi:hypothetical protein
MPGVRSTALALLGLLALGAPAAAQPSVGPESLGPLTLTDQHGVQHRIDAAVDLVLFSRDMDGGAVMRKMLDSEALGEAPAAFLGRNRAVCVADISRMPGLIARAIAKPRMRRRPYPVLLDEEGEVSAAWPSEKGRTTLIRLEANRLVEALHFEDPAALRSAIEGAAD